MWRDATHRHPIKGLKWPHSDKANKLFTGTVSCKANGSCHWVWVSIKLKQLFQRGSDSETLCTSENAQISLALCLHESDVFTEAA